MFRFQRLIWLLCCTTLMQPGFIGAQAPVAPPVAAPAAEATNPDLSLDAIQTRMKKLDDAKNLDESVRQSLVETYKKILQQLKLADEFSARATANIAAVRDAPEQLRKLKQELDQPATSSPVTINRNLTLPQMQAALSEADARLTELQKKVADLQSEPNRRADRRVEVPKLQDLARKQLQEVQAQLAAKPAADELTEVTQANRLLLEARQRALTQEIQSYEPELRAYEALGDLLTARRDQAVIQATQAEQLVKAWQAAINDKRRAESEQQAREARRATLLANPAIKRLTQESADLTSQRQVLAGQIERVSQESDRRETKLLELESQFSKVMDRVKRVGLTEAIGLVLRKQREGLPQVSDHKRDIEQRQIEITKANLQLVELEDERAALADIDTQTKLILKEVEASNPNLDVPLYEEDIRQSLLTKRGYLDSLISDINSYLDKLVELDTRDRQLIAKANEYSEFSNEHILWIRSAELPKPSDLRQLWQAVNWLSHSASWTLVCTALGSDVSESPGIYLLTLILLIVLFGCRRRWFQRLHETGVNTAKGRSPSFRPTLIALLLTFLLAVTWPVMLWILGYRLSHISSGHEFLDAFGQTLRRLALSMFTIELLRITCIPKGLADAHFDWPSAVIQTIRRSMRWLLLLGLPLAFVVLLTESQSNESFKQSLGRLSFVLTQFLLAFTAYRLWSAAAEGMAIWWSKFRRYLQVASCAAFLAIAVLATAGYYYTAVQIELRLFASIRLAFILLLTRAAIIRWLLLAYRDLAVRRLREHRAAQVAAASGSTVPSEVTPREPVATLSDIDIQTRNILRMVLAGILFVGLVWIWSEILPALRIFRRIEIWPHPFTLLDTLSPAVLPAGTLTLGDVLLSVLIAGLTFASASNIPGLLEVTFLRSLTLNSGERFAITTVCRYLITVIGVVLAFAQLGISWSQVQWLIAGMSLGLGFGLQEIFANFVSGLVLLFERPIRIGDIVTVGDVTGKVSRIRIRATTITDWDMRELIIPNKQFITGQVINSTLTDTISRMTIKIGVSADTDPEAARRILLQVAAANPLVLKTPAPHAFFDQFGDSSLNFILRVYLPSQDVFVELRHSLNTALRSAFQDAQMEIASPQYDLHLRSVPPGLAPGDMTRRPTC